MEVDKERIGKYLGEIAAETIDIENILKCILNKNSHFNP